MNNEFTDDMFETLFGGLDDGGKDDAGGGGAAPAGGGGDDGREILNQQEIDALLEAISSGDIVEAPAGAGGGPEAPARRRGERYTVYDFKRPERVSRDQLRSIATLHDVFARNFQAALSGMLRTITDVRVEAVDQLTYSEFIMNLQNPTCFTLISADPLEGNLIFEMNLAIVYPIIDRLLGGGRMDEVYPDRPMTSIEWQLVRTLIDKALSILHDEWASIFDLNFEVSAAESNPQLMPIMSSNEPVVQVCFEVFLGDKRGFFNVCYPVVTLEPVMEKLSSQSWFGGVRRDTADATGPNIREALGGAPLEVECVLAESTMTVKELLSLEPGDLIKTSHGTDEPLVINVEGIPKFTGYGGYIRDRSAIRIAGKYVPPELRSKKKQVSS